MDVTQLESEIEEKLADSAHLVMLKAIDGIGPCTYATYLPLYVRTKVHLAHLDRWWFQWGDHYRRPEPIHLTRLMEIRKQQLAAHGIEAAETDTFLVPENYWGEMNAHLSGWKSDSNSYDSYRRELEERTLRLHREMYRQPCLICGYCQRRKKLWQNSPFSLLGTPSTQRSSHQETQLSAR